MKSKNVARKLNEKSIIKKCHICGHLNESHKEISKCLQCKKSFLPTNYFAKVHSKDSQEFTNLFSESYEILEEDLIKGLTVLW